jgi:hypothetical protein
MKSFLDEFEFEFEFELRVLILRLKLLLEYLGVSKIAEFSSTASQAKRSQTLKDFKSGKIKMFDLSFVKFFAL